jgi:hypothetical protein
VHVNILTSEVQCATSIWAQNRRCENAYIRNVIWGIPFKCAPVFEWILNISWVSIAFCVRQYLGLRGTVGEVHLDSKQVMWKCLYSCCNVKNSIQMCTWTWVNYEYFIGFYCISCTSIFWVLSPRPALRVCQAARDCAGQRGTGKQRWAVRRACTCSVTSAAFSVHPRFLDFLILS